MRPIAGVSSESALSLPELPGAFCAGADAPASPSAALGITALAAGARLDFDTIYATYFHRVARWARAFGGLDAELDDLTQEVFLVVQRKLASFEGPNFQAWLYGIVRKTVSDHRRRAWFRRWFRGVDPDHGEAPESTEPGSSFERREAHRAVAAILNEMSTVRRSTFVLFEIEGYSGEEIAVLEGVPLNTVYTRLHHARRDFARLASRLDVEARPASRRPGGTP
jgi:RNA polymerase sigma-70 factor (ECF subfamily)